MPASLRSSRFSSVFPGTGRGAVGILGYDGIVYALLLRRVPLTIIHSSAAAQFVGVIIAASLVLGEPISPARRLGGACSGSSWSVNARLRKTRSRRRYSCRPNRIEL